MGCLLLQNGVPVPLHFLPRFFFLLSGAQPGMHKQSSLSSAVFPLILLHFTFFLCLHCFFLYLPLRSLHFFLSVAASFAAAHADSQEVVGDWVGASVGD